MKLRRMVLAAAVLVSTTLGTSVPASSQTSERTACEMYCAAIAAGCYVFFGLLLREACAKMYEGCVDGCYAALNDGGGDERVSGGGGF